MNIHIHRIIYLSALTKFEETQQQLYFKSPIKRYNQIQLLNTQIFILLVWLSDLKPRDFTE